MLPVLKAIELIARLVSVISLRTVYVPTPQTFTIPERTLMVSLLLTNRIS